jgi:protein-L-isoaspartate(D-aspartate) O-methyltransferase
VLKAIETTPRDLFTPDLFKDRSWEDSALPIACGQTISQPYHRRPDDPGPDDRAALPGAGDRHRLGLPDHDLSKVSRLVYTIERYRTLMKEAESRFAHAGPDQCHHQIWGWRRRLGRTGAV